MDATAFIGSPVRDQRELVEVGHLGRHRVDGGVGHPADDRAVDEEDDLVGVRRRDRVVGHHHHRPAVAVDGTAEQAQHLAGVAGVELSRGLVGQHDERVGDHCPGDGDALLLPAGELGRRPVAVPVQPDRVDRAPAAGFRPAAGQDHRHGEVLVGGELREEMETLEHGRSGPGGFGSRHLPAIVRVSPRTATGRWSTDRGRRQKFSSVLLPEPEGP